MIATAPLSCDNNGFDAAERLEGFAELTQVRGTNGEVAPSHLLEVKPALTCIFAIRHDSTSVGRDTR